MKAKIIFWVWVMCLVFSIKAVAQPDIRVNWNGNTRESLAISVDAYADIFEQCLKNGLDVRYRYKFMLCHRRDFWVDSCEDELEEVRSMHFDPISQEYEIMVDRYRDDVRPKVSQVADSEKAWELLSKIDSLTLTELGKKNTDLSRTFLSVKVHSDCKGEYNQTLARLSYLLSLGLLRVDGYNSGWVDFNLAK